MSYHWYSWLLFYPCGVLNQFYIYSASFNSTFCAAEPLKVYFYFVVFAKLFTESTICTRRSHEIMCHLCQHWISIPGIKWGVSNEICKHSGTTTMANGETQGDFFFYVLSLLKLPLLSWYWVPAYSSELRLAQHPSFRPFVLRYIYFFLLSWVVLQQTGLGYHFMWLRMRSTKCRLVPNRYWS